MRPRCKSDQGLLNFDFRELDKFRRSTDHKEIATAAAMNYCSTHLVCPPEWLVAAAADLLTELLKREKTTRRGSNASCLARFHQERKDLERWDAVMEVRRIRSMAQQDKNALKRSPKLEVTNSFTRSHKKRKEWLKQGTFECAAILLKGRDAYVTAYGVRNSYKKMEKSLNDPSHAIGAWFDDAFLKKLGLQDTHERKPGTNIFLFLP